MQPHQLIDGFLQAHKPRRVRAIGADGSFDGEVTGLGDAPRRRRNRGQLVGRTGDIAQQQERPRRFTGHLINAAPFVEAGEGLAGFFVADQCLCVLSPRQRELGFGRVHEGEAAGVFVVHRDASGLFEIGFGSIEVTECDG